MSKEETEEKLFNLLADHVREIHPFRYWWFRIRARIVCRCLPREIAIEKLAILLGEYDKLLELAYFEISGEQIKIQY